MIKIPNKLRCKFNFNECTYQGDLEPNQGSLVKHFTSNQFGYYSEYLFTCIDKNPYMNRWLVLGVSKQSLVDYLLNKCTLLDLFSSSDLYSFATVYIIDLGKNNKLINSYYFGNDVIRNKYLPERYLPSSDLFLQGKESPYIEALLQKLLQKTEYDYFKKEYPEFDQNIEAVRFIIESGNPSKKVEYKMSSTDFISYLKSLVYQTYHRSLDNKQITIKYLDGSYGVFKWVYSQGDRLIISKFIPF